MGFGDEDDVGLPGLSRLLRTENEFRDSIGSDDWLKYADEKFGSPHCRQCHDRLLLSMMLYIVSDR